MSKIITKGDRDGECYRSVCTNKPATYYNFSTRMWYCAGCAETINYHSELDSYRIFGHHLCISENNLDFTDPSYPKLIN